MPEPAGGMATPGCPPVTCEGGMLPDGGTIGCAGLRGVAGTEGVGVGLAGGVTPGRTLPPGLVGALPPIIGPTGL